jgi:hypothetical protein
MALFTDSGAVALDDLLQFEISLVQTASSHGIDVDTKINLATSAVGDKIMLWLLNTGASDPQFLIRRVIGLANVVVTPPVQRWLCFEALSRFFAEAYNTQLNTRFQGKWTEYQTQAQDAEQMAFMSGIGVVANPLPRPALPLVSVEQGVSPAQALYIQTAWVDSAGSESALSPTNGMILPDSSSVAVSMTEGAVNAPPTAIGWNIYVSSSAIDLTRQNLTPLPVGSTWELPPTGLTEGPQPIDGQIPQNYVMLSRRILRG